MGNGPIINAASKTLLQQPQGSVPNMSDTLSNWLQAMTFGIVTKSQSNFEVTEQMTEVSFQGVWQPYSFQQLKILAEGERRWKWFTVHTKTNLELQVDDVVIYQGTQYRVMMDGSYPEYGFYEYHLVDDYTGSGPTVVVPPEPEPEPTP